ncbi:MAG TPA: hypothetical protein VFA07_16895 [Chthonomonadaceae bacterium]|nr:hypothetical protein [Chthonomonadaceae bacterium]
MSNTQERIKQRRQYLKKRRGAYTEFSIATFCLILCAVIDVVVVGGFVVWLYISLTSKVFSVTHLAAGLVSMAWMMLMFGYMTWVMIQAGIRARLEAKQLPYVPPVTPDTLPAEEVLVRGSEEPTQEQCNVLLRSADGSTGTGEQELLRSSQGQ